MANPPINIGPFNSVPAPGSPIRSDWPQAISEETATRRGVGLRQASQAMPNAATTNILWPTENYDTDGFHAAGSENVVIPAGLGGLYAVTLVIASNAGVVGATSDAVLSIAGNLYPAYIPAGKNGTVSAVVVPIAAGATVQGRIFNGNANPTFFQATLELNYLRTLAP